jgi:hypothetical protein
MKRELKLTVSLEGRSVSASVMVDSVFDYTPDDYAKHHVGLDLHTEWAAEAVNELNRVKLLRTLVGTLPTADLHGRNIELPVFTDPL